MGQVSCANRQPVGSAAAQEGLGVHLDLREATLIGHSMGGAEIVRYLTRHGAGRFARIALVSAALPFMLRTEDNPEGMKPSAAEAARDGWRADLARGLAEIAPPFLGHGVPGCSVSPELRGMAPRRRQPLLAEGGPRLQPSDHRDGPPPGDAGDHCPHPGRPR